MACRFLYTSSAILSFWLAWWVSSACASSALYFFLTCLRYRSFRRSLLSALFSCFTAHRLFSFRLASVTSSTRWIPRKASCRISQPSSDWYHFSSSWSLICWELVNTYIIIEILVDDFKSNSILQIYLNLNNLYKLFDKFTMCHNSIKLVIYFSKSQVTSFSYFLLDYLLRVVT